MKLDLSILRYMQREEFRVLTAVEMGMKNHDQVANELIDQISGLKSGGCHKILNLLHKNKLLHHENKHYDSYRLTPMGYDYLALNALRQRDAVTDFGKQIGVGKEADIYLVSNPEKEALCCKIHRLGRTSFRNIKAQRDYLLHRKSASWLYLSRLSAIKEYAFMRVLYEHGFPVPEPIDHSRHIVIMRLIEGTQLNQIAELSETEQVYDTCMSIIVRLGKVGLIHSDFNEFNIMVDEAQVVTVIDFPQMVSISHRNAKYYFDRDVLCIVTFFKKRFKFVSEKPTPNWEGVLATRQGTLDVISAASGFIGEKEIAEFEKAGGLGERFGDEDSGEQTADIEEGDDDSESDEEDGYLRDKDLLAVVNEGTGQGGERVIQREEDVDFKSSRQAEAMALRRIAVDTEQKGNFDPLGAGKRSSKADQIGEDQPYYHHQPEPEPEPSGGEEGKSMLGEMATSTLEVKRSEQEKSGHRRDAAEARLERLARLGDENSDDDEEEEESDNEEELREEGLERANTCPEDVAGKVHFIMPKRQLVGGEPEDSDDDDEEEQKKAHPRFNKGSGRRPAPKKLTEEEQAALIRRRVGRSKGGRAQQGGGRGGNGRGAGNKSKSKNATNKNTKAMMRESGAGRITRGE